MCSRRHVEVMSVSTLDEFLRTPSGDDIMPNGSHDTICNRSGNTTFQEVIEARLSRRGFLSGGLTMAATVSLGGVGALLDAVPLSAKSRHAPGSLLGFPVIE
jgi:hypothetical protein